MICTNIQKVLMMNRFITILQWIICQIFLITGTWKIFAKAIIFIFYPAADSLKTLAHRAGLQKFYTIKESIMSSIFGEMICGTIGQHGAKCCPFILVQGFKIRFKS